MDNDQTGDFTSGADFQQMQETIMQSAREGQAMVEQFIDQQPADVRQAMDPLNLTPMFLKFTGKMLQDPKALLDAQAKFAERYFSLINNQLAAGAAMFGKAEADVSATPVAEPERGDKRFKSDSWQHSPFDFIKQAYLLMSESMMGIVADTDDLSTAEKKRMSFFTRQYLDAISPSNFLLTNPDALKATIESGGQNLMDGAKNLLEDIERGKGLPSIKMVDTDAFEIGENIATAPGEVVFRNRVFELIQYSPTTAEVYAKPLLFFPPWINKYYILDLTEKKSMIRWLVDQGYTVFITSWVNPDSSYRDFGMDHMLEEGFLEAIRATRDISGQDSVNVVGYCVSGTFLSATLAYLKAKGREKEVESATFFTAQVDFSEAGELGLFVDDEQLKNMGQMMQEKGYLDKRNMALTFNMLRSNDLIWSYVVNNYLLGKKPMAFDLLYWNCDSTNLPRQLHLDYLNNMYLNNKLIEPGGITLGGVELDISTVDTPTYIQAGRDDHIAPAQSVYKATRYFCGDNRFMLAGSGHIAGVVNPPAAGKYQYWTGPDDHSSLDDFITRATENPGSWWGDWDKWLAARSGEKVKARKPGSNKKYPAICPAPGTYVRMQGE